MAKKIIKKDYVLLVRGGANPEDMTPEQMKTTMNNWMAWMDELKKRNQLTLAHPLEDGGKILSGAKGKNAKAFKDDKDAVGGFFLIKAKSLADATKIAKGCPIFNNGGTVELRAVEQM
jgi:hypothetical protein